MKILNRFSSKEIAMYFSGFMKYICYGIIFFLSLGILLSLMGRQTFILHTKEKVYQHAIYSEKNHDFTSRGPTISLPDEVRIITEDNNIDLISQVGLSLMYIITVFPIIISFYFLSIVFKNVSLNSIFNEQNANYLLYYAFIQIFYAIVAPFVKLFICFLTNLFTNNIIGISTGKDFFNNLIPNIAFIVAAYIIHYGISLQDEVEHTL